MTIFVNGFMLLCAGTLLLEANAQSLSCSAIECSSSMAPPTLSLLPSSAISSRISVSASSQFNTFLTTMTESSQTILSSTPKSLQSSISDETASSNPTLSSTLPSSTSTAQPSDTPTSSSPPTDGGSMTPNTSNNDFINDVTTIVIISCVMAFLLLVICILMTAVVVLCQRSIGARRRQQRTSKSRQRKQSPVVQVVETSMREKQKPTSPGADSKNKALLSPEKRPEFGSISDVPLLCRVLQDYDVSQHNARITQYARSSVASSSSYYDSPVHGVRTPVIGLNGMSPAHYDSPKSTQFPRSTSNELEASIRTQVSMLSQDDSADYDELEKIIVSLEEQVEQFPSPPNALENPLSPAKPPTKSPQSSPPRSPLKSPPKSPYLSPPITSPKSSVKPHMRHAPSVAVVVSTKLPRSPVRNQETMDDFGYQVIDTGRIGQSQPHKDTALQSQSADVIFDDPKYTVPVIPSQTTAELSPIPEDTQSGTQPNTNQSLSTPTAVVDRNSSPSFFPHEMARNNGEKLPFMRKEFKEYMSLHQVLELVEKKMSPSREPSTENETGIVSENGSEDNDDGDLYCPRVVMPPPAVANTSN